MSLNYVEALVDEIALEGLDGITLQALWVRLQHRKNFDFFIDDSSKNFLWNIVKKLRNIELFILPKARADLVLPNGEDDPEVTLVSVQMHMKQLYPHCLVDMENIRGSCPTFEKRIPAPETVLSLSAEECQKEWGGRLGLVASQETRTAALIGSSKHPFFEMATIQYCVLERIGRSRHYGVLTYGPGSIQDVIKEDPRSHFYMRKKFLEHELITKQFQSVNTKSGNNNCYVLHLTRFHCVVKSKTMLRGETILSFLKQAPDHFLPYDQLRSKLGVPQGVFKKLVTAMHNKGILDTHSSVAYRTLHPNAKQIQWQNKNSGQEKSIRVIRLIEGATEKHGEEEVQIEGETLNSDDEGDEEMEGETSTRGFLDISKRTLDRSLTHQAYKILEGAGSEGLTQRYLGEMLGLGKLDSRMICKLLLREGIVSVKMQDVGRQRVTRYIAIRVQEKDTKFEAEKQKFLNLVGDPKVLERLLLREQKNPFTLLRQFREEAEELYDTPKEVEDIEGNLQDVQQGDTITAEYSQNQEADELGCEETDDPVDPLDISDLKTNSSGQQSTKSEDESLMTYRSLRRINIILDHVLQHKIVDDFHKFYKVIQDAEKEEGYVYKIDRRSLHRLIARLQQEKCIKIFKAVVKSDEKKRTLMFVCSPDTEKDHSSIQGAIEQAKFRVFNVPTPEVKPPKEKVALEIDPLLNQESIILSMQEIQKLNIEANANTLAVKALEKEKSNCYGHCPKFVRMRLLHKLLFYLTRSYEGKGDLDQTEIIENLKLMGHHDLPQDLPKVYKLDDHVNWKMFISPLPNHEGWPRGWTILSDIVLRVPLSIFVRIMWVRYVVPGLDGYLNHPIKQHYLLGHLPRSIRCALLANRKFVFSLFETAQRLCFMGLLQFGPQRLKEKDQLFVYVNLNASIIDTTPSEMGYFQISTNIEYEKKTYTLSSIEELEKYWCDLYTTSVCTQLGGKTGQEGKEIILEALENKPALVEACMPRTAADVEQHDNGSIPGDHLGASGLDSAFFAHLKRNWNSKYIMLNSSTQPREQKTMEGEANYNSVTIKIGEAEGVPSTSKKLPPPTAEAQPLVICNIKKKTTFLKEPRKKERKIIKRKLQKPNFKKKKIRKNVPDVGTLQERCSWSTEEDVYLILCKVAGMYLSRESNKTVIKNELITKILKKYAPSPKPKDGLRYLRRMNFLFNRSQSAQLDMALCLEECRQDVQITEKYLNFRQNLRAKKLTVEKFETAMDKGFEELVDTLKQKYRSFPDDMLLDTPIPDTLQEFHATYNVVNPLLNLRNRGKYNEPETMEQVYFNTIIALILSSMGTSADKTNYSVPLIKIYQQFPDKWLRNAINKLRNDQMVSSKKLFSRALKNKNHIPLTSSPFQLSVYYFHLMQSKFQYELFHEAWNTLQKMHNNASTGIMLDPLADSGGRTACIFEGSATGLISMDVEMPAQIIILEFDTSIDEEEKKCLEECYENIINTDKVETSSEPTTVKAQKRPLEALENSDTANAPEAKRRKCDDGADAETTEKTSECSVIENKAINPEPNLIAPTESDIHEEAEKSPENEPAYIIPNIDGHRDKLLEANVSARMKFYAVRDELSKTRPSCEGQDQRARLAMKPCLLNCKFDASHLPDHSQKFKNVIYNIKSGIVVNEEAGEWDDAVRVYSEAGATKNDLDTATRLVQIIKEREHLGATISLLRSNFTSSSGEMKLSKHLLLLRSTKIILRVGVTTIHYVHWSYKMPWTINSAKLKRLERDSLPPLNAVTLDLGENKSDEEEQESGTDLTESIASTSSETSTKLLAEQITVSKKFDKSSTLTHSSKTAVEATHQLSSQLSASSEDKTLVTIRPWVRIDGSLNRRVLDRLLGAVLCHLLYHPGCTLQALQQRFCPALQPYHTFELLEILQMIGTVNVQAIHSQGTVTLFSSPLLTTIEPADFTESESSIFIEPAVDAILLMSQFIGNKNYNSDFLDDVKNRPYTDAS